MPLIVVGVNHHTAPVEVRERFAFADSEAARALTALRKGGAVREAVILSTCNRTELYLHPASEEARRAGERLLAEKAGEVPGGTARYLYRHREEEAARHLFRVVSGMDSMVLGEAEIQGQVKDAYQRSGDLPGDPSLAGPVLHRLFQSALSVGGRIRHETSLDEGAASVASVAVDLARKVFGGLGERRVLVLGAGSTGELVVNALAREGVRGVLVTNRTYGRARSLAEKMGGEAIPFRELPRALREADIVVASTAAPHPILSPETVREAFPEGPRHPFLVIDIAIPRDVDPSVGDVPNLFLYNVDDLQQIVDETLEKRKESLPRAEDIVREEARSFRSWYATLEVVPVIRSLRERAEDLRKAEMERILGSLSHLSEEERARVREFSRRFLNKLLHEPTVRLREGAANGRGPELVDAVRFLYDLERSAKEARREEEGRTGEAGSVPGRSITEPAGEREDDEG